MNFYGVGTVFGGKGPNEVEKLNEFLEKDFWCMGYADEDRPEYAELIKQIQVGDIIIAKAYGLNAIYYVKAIGVVIDTKKPENIAEELKTKSGVSVIWFKKFKPYIQLTKDNFCLGADRPRTIYKESNEKNISVIKKLMKFDYSCIKENDYVKLAKLFVLHKAKNEYDDKEITECLDNDVKIKVGDIFGRKILLVPITLDETVKYGLILLVPDKEQKDDPMSLINVKTEILDDTENLSELVSEMKKQTSWDKPLNW